VGERCRGAGGEVGAGSRAGGAGEGTRGSLKGTEARRCVMAWPRCSADGIGLGKVRASNPHRSVIQKGGGFIIFSRVEFGLKPRNAFAVVDFKDAEASSKFVRVFGGRGQQWNLICAVFSS